MEYHAGSTDLVKKELIQVTAWLESDENLKPYKEPFLKYQTKWVILRDLRDRIHRYLKGHRVYKKKIKVWKYALFREKIDLSDEAEEVPPPPRIPTYGAHGLQSMEAGKFGRAVTKILNGEERYKIPRLKKRLPTVDEVLDPLSVTEKIRGKGVKVKSS